MKQEGNHWKELNELEDKAEWTSLKMQHKEIKRTYKVRWRDMKDSMRIAKYLTIKS